MKAIFYMRGNHVLEVENLSNVSVTKDLAKLTGYTLTWYEGYRPPLLMISIEDVVAITVERTWLERMKEKK